MWWALLFLFVGFRRHHRVRSIRLELQALMESLGDKDLSLKRIRQLYLLGETELALKESVLTLGNCLVVEAISMHVWGYLNKRLKEITGQSCYWLDKGEVWVATSQGYKFLRSRHPDKTSFLWNEH
jgi:hypothetical protein